MPSELENAMKSAAASAAKYVQDAAELTVETRYVEISAGAEIDFAQAKPVARTIVRLDGDSETILPARKNASGGMEVDVTLFELHQQNVNTAIEYRARILNALLGALQRRSSGA
ncbi:MAG: hypothetical protein L0Z70_09910 [Chloroflexi bacterium]|nr:hypothetical protein [Chloroflexota bacterium]